MYSLLDYIYELNVKPGDELNYDFLLKTNLFVIDKKFFNSYAEVFSKFPFYNNLFFDKGYSDDFNYDYLASLIVDGFNKAAIINASLLDEYVKLVHLLPLEEMISKGGGYVNELKNKGELSRFIRIMSDLKPIDRHSYFKAVINNFEAVKFINDNIYCSNKEMFLRLINKVSESGFISGEVIFESKRLIDKLSQIDYDDDKIIDLAKSIDDFYRIYLIVDEVLQKDDLAYELLHLTNNVLLSKRELINFMLDEMQHL